MLKIINKETKPPVYISVSKINEVVAAYNYFCVEKKHQTEKHFMSLSTSFKMMMASLQKTKEERKVIAKNIKQEEKVIRSQQMIERLLQTIKRDEKHYDFEQNFNLEYDEMIFSEEHNIMAIPKLILYNELTHVFQIYSIETIKDSTEQTIAATNKTAHFKIAALTLLIQQYAWENLNLSNCLFINYSYLINRQDGTIASESFISYESIKEKIDLIKKASKWFVYRYNNLMKYNWDFILKVNITNKICNI
jgi:hypothetical protein